jgi:hypothetical protein
VGLSSLAPRLLLGQTNGWTKGKIMAREILVALQSEDRLSQMIPYIERIAQPGMKVVFLIRFSLQPAFKRSQQDPMELMSPGEHSAYLRAELKNPRLTEENTSSTQLMENQRLAAEHKVFLALESLLKRGVEITVDLYKGSLRRAVKNYTRKGNVHLIMRRARRALMTNFWHKVFSVFGLAKPPTFFPIVVSHPAHVI